MSDEWISCSHWGMFPIVTKRIEITLWERSER
jgi:hypothetical protein